MTNAQILKVKYFPYVEFDEEGNQAYYEYENGWWVNIEYDQHGNEVHSEDKNGYWTKREYDDSGNNVYYSRGSRKTTWLKE
jgi:hypothetical protein